jgi:hypothetical protein
MTPTPTRDSAVSPVRELSDERLAEMLAGLEGVTAGPWGVWREPTFTQADAIRELTFQVENTPVEDFAKAVYLLDAGGKCPATTGCGPSSAANAAHIARCDPDTMRAILTELLSRRSLDTADGVETFMAHVENIGGGYGANLRPHPEGRWVRLSDYQALASRTSNTEMVVKALEWETNSVVSIWTGELIFGVYYTIYDEGSGHRVFRHQFLSEGSETEVAYVSSQDEAKAAAQADFDQRIRSTLSALPAGEGEAVAEWGDAKTVGNLIAQLRTFDPSTPIYGAFHADAGDGRKARIRGLTLSRERINGRVIDTGNVLVPYAVVVWSAPQDDPEPRPQSVLPSEGEVTYRHKKRGTEYVMIGIGKMQAERWQSGEYVSQADIDRYTAAEINARLGVDMREVAIYRSVDDGSLWARPREEFEDGRFISLQLNKKG